MSLFTPVSAKPGLGARLAALSKVVELGSGHSTLVSAQAARGVRDQIEAALRAGAKAHIEESTFAASRPGTPPVDRLLEPATGGLPQ